MDFAQAKMETMEEDMGQVAVRVLPPGVPEDAEPITEDQLERLPEYVQTTIQDFVEGKMASSTTREELERVRAAFFAAAPQAVAAAPQDGAAAAASSSNSMICEDNVDEESMRID